MARKCMLEVRTSRVRGMKAETTRNFEAGILTDDTEIIEQAMNQFDEVWIGKHCKKCKRREFCPDPIVS